MNTFSTINNVHTQGSIYATVDEHKENLNTSEPGSNDPSVLFKNRFTNAWKLLTVIFYLLAILAIALSVAGFVYMKTGQNLDSPTRQSNVDYSILQQRLIASERNVSKLTNVVKILLTWKLYNGSIYRLTPNEQSWNESQEVCESYGAHLATSIIDDCNALKQISQSLVTNQAWVGLRKNFRERWKQVTRCWRSHQPDNYNGNEDCVATESFGQYKLSDKPCSVALHGLCEKRFHE